MERLNRFQVRDCKGVKLATFSVPMKFLDDFIIETDMPFTKECVKMACSYFWWLIARYCTHRTITCLKKAMFNQPDFFLYISYYPYK